MDLGRAAFGATWPPSDYHDGGAGSDDDPITERTAGRRVHEDKDWLGAWVEVLIDAPRGTFVKRRADGSVDFVSPLPTPFNYGDVPGEWGGDGDPLDAVVLGPRLPRGHRGRYRVVGVVAFTDAGRTDNKLVCGHAGPGARAAIVAFFTTYAVAKRALAWWRGLPGDTTFHGVRWA